MKKTFLLAAIIALSLTLRAQNATQRATVYIFLSETCPICQSYTVTLNSLFEEYKTSFTFIGVFPDPYSNDDSIKAFASKYKILFRLKRDPGGLLTKKLDATVTPEVFIEGSDGLILYSGRIDNTYYRIGGRRNITTTSELADALEAIVEKKQIPVKHTTPVGCIIMKN